MVRSAIASMGIAAACVACDGQPRDAAVPVAVQDSAGVQIFTVGEVPSWDDPTYQWRIVSEREVATAVDDVSAEPMIFDPEGITRFPDGTIVVLDGAGLRLVVVHPVLDSVTARFAPRGRGPGEIWSTNTQIWANGDTSIGVLDAGTRRVSYFDLAGTLLESRSVDFPGGGGLTTQRPGTGETFAWRYFRDSETGLLSDSVIKLDLSGPTVAVAPLHRDRRPMPPGEFRPLFSGSGTFAPIGSGGVVVGTTNVAEFRHFTDAAVLEAIIRVPLEKRALTLEDEQIVREEVARFAPALADNLGEHATLWSRLEPFGDSLFALDQISVTTAAGEPRIPRDTRVWRIFSIRGHYLGAAVLPPGVGPPYWNDGERLMALKRDDLGVATIVVYRLQPPDLRGTR